MTDDFASGVGSTQRGAEHLMTQTILDISLSLEGFAPAANVRPEEPMGDGQGWVSCGASGR
jgi:hypothetical protein